MSDFQKSALLILCSCDASLALSGPEPFPKSFICNQLRLNLPGNRPVRKHDSGFDIAKLDGGFQYGGVVDALGEFEPDPPFLGCRYLLFSMAPPLVAC